MKKWIIAYLSVLAFISVYAGKPTATSVTTNTVMIAAQRPIQNATAWVTNTAYALNKTIKANDQYFFSIVAGTSATSGTGPTHVDGDAVDGNVTWRAIPRGKRGGIAIQNNSTNDIYISIGSPAIAGTGLRLGSVSGSNMGGSWWSDSEPVYQGSIYAVNDTGDATTNSLIAVEW